LPRTAADAGAAPCPACGWRVGDALPAAQPDPAPPPEPVPPPPEPDADPHTRRNLWLVGGAVGVAAAVLLAMLLSPGDAPPAPPADPPPLERIAAVPAPAPPAPEAEEIPPPREVPPDPIVIPLPIPVPSEVAVIRVDSPDGDYQFPRLTAGNHVKLVGRARRLLIDGLDGGATLDATGLDTKAVSVAGKVDGGSTLLVKCPDGSVYFKGKVDGGSRVVVDAPGATVSFMLPTADGKDGSKIGGGSRVTITARSVGLAGTVTGAGTVLDLTLTPTGRLEFVRLDDRARVRYRQEHRADKPVVVKAGKVSGGAECKEEEAK
jgi:hypothetical protein